MLHSILITGGNQSQRLKALAQLEASILQPNPDLLTLKPEPLSIGIQAIKKLIHFLAQRPYCLNRKTALILQADKLTLAAQNALLKTLEEPPDHSFIALLAPTQHPLKATIISRCQLINLASQNQLSPDQQSQQAELFSTITQASIGARINLSALQAKNKDSALNFVQLQLKFLHPQIKKYPFIIKQLLLAQKQLHANLNPRLVIENLLFHYPKL